MKRLCAERDNLQMLFSRRWTQMDADAEIVTSLKFEVWRLKSRVWLSCLHFKLQTRNFKLFFLHPRSSASIGGYFFLLRDSTQSRYKTLQ